MRIGPDTLNMPAISLIILSTAAVGGPADAGGWGKGPSFHQAQKDLGNVAREGKKGLGNVAKAVHQAIGLIHLQSGGGQSDGAGEHISGDNEFKEDNGSKQILLPLWGPAVQTMLPGPSGPTIGSPEPRILVPTSGCIGMNCESPAELNPAGDLPEKEIETPVPVAD